MSQSLHLRCCRARNALGKYPTLLVGVPHPNPSMAGRGKSLRDWCRFLLNNGGPTAKTRACKVVEEAVRRREEPALPLQPSRAENTGLRRSESRHGAGRNNRSLP